MIQLVEKMELSPCHCMVCLQSPYETGEDEVSRPAPAVDLGVDINFGDQAYLCKSCARLVAQIIDYVDGDEYKALREERDDLDAKLLEIREEYKALQFRVRQILDGKKAKRDLQKDLKPKSKPREEVKK